MLSKTIYIKSIYWQKIRLTVLNQNLKLFLMFVVVIKYPQSVTISIYCNQILALVVFDQKISLIFIFTKYLD